MITYRSAPSGASHAAYQGTIRVGYVYVNRSSSKGDWMWHLNLLSVQGGYPTGRAPTPEDAKIALQRAFTVWLGEANLREIQS